MNWVRLAEVQQHEAMKAEGGGGRGDTADQYTGPSEATVTTANDNGKQIDLLCVFFIITRTLLNRNKARNVKGNWESCKAFVHCVRSKIRPV